MMVATQLLCFLIAINAASCGVLPRNYTVQQYLDNLAIRRFRKYVQIDTSKEENLERAVEFWQEEAKALNLTFAVHRPAGKPICVLSWPGTDCSKPSIMLNSHMDVVPVEPEDWKYPPFSAHVDENGDIFGRGTQDDKDVAIQYLEAIRNLKENNITLTRTLHITLMPDEEVGGSHGMQIFVKTKEFEDLNVGFALDEGITSSDDTLYVTYVDKRAWQIKISVTGQSGHSSAVSKGATAVQKIQQLMNVIDAHRESQAKVKDASAATDYGAYDSININIIHGDVAVNVVPGKMYLVVDTRWAVSRSVDEMQMLVDSWISTAGNGTQVEYIRRVENSDATLVDNTNHYWVAMQKVASDMGLSIKPAVCPAISDMIHIRSLGIPALGFATKSHTESRIHGANEYLNAATFLRGIGVYVEILHKLGNL